MNKQYYDLIDESLYSFTCNNGLQVYLLKKEDYYKTYGVFATKFGSLNTLFKSNGVQHQVIDGAAHFLEHKMFEKENYDVMDKFATQQASSNAFTSFDKTAYLFSATANVEQNVETLLDFVQSLELSDESVEKEKPIIASEIAMYDDDADWQLFFQSLQTMYHNMPIKIDIAGTKETIYQITKNDLETYYQNFYHPSNMILFVCGNIDVESLEKVITSNQDAKSFEKIDLELVKVDEPDSVVNKELTKVMEVANTKIMYSLKINEYILEPVKQDFAMGILCDILFSKASDFFQDLLTSKKITNNYSYSFDQDIYYKYAFFQMQFISDDDAYLTDYVKDYLSKDLTQFIKEEDFTRIKNKFIGDFIRLFNNPESIANSFISFKFDDLDLFEILNYIEDITLDEIKSLTKLFDLDYLTITKIVNKDYKQLL